MNNPTQHLNSILRIHGRVATALALAILFGPGVLATESAQAQTFTTFNVPGAGTGALQGSFPISINTAGTIEGIVK